MNFGGFKTRVKAATEAARQFQGFDQMAAQDDYIHSPDLNVKGKKAHSGTGTTQSQALDSLVAFSSTSASLSSDVSFHTAGGKEDGGLQSTASTPVRRPLDEVFGTPLGARNCTQADYSDDDEDDEEEVPTNYMPRDKDGVERKKNANRFMEDLDMRLSRANSSPADAEPGPTLQVMEITDAHHSAGAPATSVVNQAWKGWVQTARSSLTLGAKPGEERLPFKSLLTRTPLNVPSDDDKTSHEEHVKLVSSSVLGAEEQAELDRIRNRVSASDILSGLLQTIQHNPRFAFIIFTFVLGYAVYVYSSRHGDEDDVT